MTTIAAGSASFLIFWILCQSLSFAQVSATRVVPTVVTAHYDKSEPPSHGVVHIRSTEKKIKVEVKDLRKNSTYDVVLLNESNGKRVRVGSLAVDRRGFASAEFDITQYFDTYNALLIASGEDVIQYAQLHESHHGCICKHSGGSIVTRRLDQECYECPCGVNYEICCGMKK